MPTVFFLKYKFYILILFAFYPWPFEESSRKFNPSLRFNLGLLLFSSFVKLLESGSSNTFKRPVVTQQNENIIDLQCSALRRSFLTWWGGGGGG